MGRHRQNDGPIRGAVYAILFSIPLWIILGLIIWGIYHYSHNY